MGRWLSSILFHIERPPNLTPLTQATGPKANSRNRSTKRKTPAGEDSGAPCDDAESHGASSDEFLETSSDEDKPEDKVSFAAGDPPSKGVYALESKTEGLMCDVYDFDFHRLETKGAAMGRRGGEMVFLKLYKDRSQSQRVRAIHRQLDGLQGIAQILGGFKLAVGTVLVFEFMKGNHEVPEEHRLDFCRSFFTLLNSCQLRGVIHGDLHPHNVVYDSVSRQVSLIDFDRGSVESVHGRLKVEGFLCSPYEPPEFESDRRISFEADAFAAGLVACELLQGPLPEAAQLVRRGLLGPKERCSHLLDIVRWRETQK